MGTKTYPGLDLVRLGAALLVVFYHLGFLIAPHPVSAFSPGWVGVEIFFVISGFVIAFSADGKSVGRFAMSRAWRLYPAALICSTIIALMGWPNAPSLLTYLRSVTIFPIGPWVNNVYWTLPIEMSFYAVVSVSLWRGWPLTKVALWLGAYSCTFWLFYLVNNALHFAHLPKTESGKYALLLLNYGVFFALGMLLYARKHLRPAIVFGVAAMVAILTNPLGGYAPAVIWLFAVGLIGAGIVWNDRLQWLRTRTLGLLTYPLYLVHSSLGTPFLNHLPFPYALIVGVAIALLGAFAVLQFEIALRRLLRSGWKKFVIAVPRGSAG